MKDFSVLPARPAPPQRSRRVAPGRDAAAEAGRVDSAATFSAGFANRPLRSSLGARMLAADSADEATPMQEPGAAQTPATAPKAPAAAAGCAETITWVPTTPVPIDIRADSAVDFANQMDAALGGNPHTTANVSLSPVTAGGKMTAVNLSLDTAIIRPRWAGGRVSAAERELIKRVETFIKEHEERHRDISRSVMQSAVCAAVDQPVATAKAVLKKAICDTEPSAQEAMDNKEGRITWTKDATGAVVDFAAAGEKHDYHVKGCDPFAPVAEAPADKPQPKDAGADQ